LKANQLRGEPIWKQHSAHAGNSTTRTTRRQKTTRSPHSTPLSIDKHNRCREHAHRLSRPNIDRQFSVAYRRGSTNATISPTTASPCRRSCSQRREERPAVAQRRVISPSVGVLTRFVPSRVHSQPRQQACEHVAVKSEYVARRTWMSRNLSRCLSLACRASRHRDHAPTSLPSCEKTPPIHATPSTPMSTCNSHATSVFQYLSNDVTAWLSSQSVSKGRSVFF
jgi:hypothetical protein